MMPRILRPLRRSRAPRRAIGLLAAISLTLGCAAQAADHRGHGFHGGHHGGFVHHGFPHHHFHSFVVFGAGAGFYPGYYAAYPYYPVYVPPPVYVSRDECYNTVPRGPGVADLFTCGGQYVGPIAVP